MRFVLERAVVASKSGSFKTSGKGSGFKNFLCSLAGVGEKSQGDRLSRCSSLKNSPLSSPSKPSVDARIEELKNDRDAWQKQATHLLAAPDKRGLLQKIFGKN